MAKSKNHTNHNQNAKAHKNGIKKPQRVRWISTKGVRVPGRPLSLSAGARNVEGGGGQQPPQLARTRCWQRLWQGRAVHGTEGGAGLCVGACAPLPCDQRAAGLLCRVPAVPVLCCGSPLPAPHSTCDRRLAVRCRWTRSFCATSARPSESRTRSRSRE